MSECSEVEAMSEAAAAVLVARAAWAEWEAMGVAGSGVGGREAVVKATGSQAVGVPAVAAAAAMALGTAVAEAEARMAMAATALASTTGAADSDPTRSSQRPTQCRAASWRLRLVVAERRP